MSQACGASLLPGSRSWCASYQLRFDVQITLDVKAPIKELNGLSPSTMCDLPSAPSTVNPCPWKDSRQQQAYLLTPRPPLTAPSSFLILISAMYSRSSIFTPPQPITIRAAAAATNQPFQSSIPGSRHPALFGLGATCMHSAQLSVAWMCPLHSRFNYLTHRRIYAVGGVVPSKERDSRQWF